MDVSATRLGLNELVLLPWTNDVIIDVAEGTIIICMCECSCGLKEVLTGNRGYWKQVKTP